MSKKELATDTLMSFSVASVVLSDIDRFIRSKRRKAIIRPTAVGRIDILNDS